jgi:hypothetical protein
MSNGYQQVSRDTAAAERGVVPDHPVDNYNSQAAAVTPPTAAKFNQGVEFVVLGAGHASVWRRSRDRESLLKRITLVDKI